MSLSATRLSPGHQGFKDALDLSIAFVSRSCTGDTGEAQSWRFARTRLATVFGLLSPATRHRRPRRSGSDDPLEIGVRSGIAVDRHMLRHIKLQPLDGPKQRNSIWADIRRRRRSRSRGPV